MTRSISLAGFPQAMPLEGLIGGMLIGLAAAILLLGLGRIAGVSGLTARATGIADSGAPRSLAMAFVLGLPWRLLRRRAVLKRIFQLRRFNS
jgi:uncharacterized membrane protein YedE/YeeE